MSRAEGVLPLRQPSVLTTARLAGDSRGSAV